MSLEDVTNSEISQLSASAVAVRELTSATKDDDEKSNIDFKTRLNIKEISAHACLEWLNDVLVNEDKFKTELRIIDLIDRMKRLRPSVEGKAREGLQDVMKSEINAKKQNNRIMNKSSRNFLKYILILNMILMILSKECS